MPPLLAPTEPLTDGVVTLRFWVVEDAEARAAAFLDPETIRWTDLPERYDAAEAAEDIKRGHGWNQRGERLAFAITDARDQLLGAIDLMPSDYERAELGYLLTAPARGRGYATRAVRLLSDWTLANTHIERLELPIPVGNSASAGVAKRAGYEAEGTLRSYLALRDDGPRYDVTMFALLRPSGDSPALHTVGQVRRQRTV